MNWELYTYGGGEFLRLILNGVAALTATDDFFGLLRATALFALLWVLAESAFNLRRMNLQWVLLMAMIYLVIIVPRANVIITDRINPRASSVVAGVPLGMAFFVGTTSRVGDWLTRSFETAFALPTNLQYQRSGALFSHHLLQSASRFEIIDSRLRNNLSEFWRQCVFYDLLLGQYEMDALRDAADLRSFISTRTSRARMYPYQQVGGGRVLQFCRDGWNGSLRNDLNAELVRARRYHGSRLVNATTINEAVARFSVALPVAYQFIGGLSRNADQLIVQQALAASLERGVLDFSVANNAPAAAQAYTMARAQRERRTTFTALGQLASRTLPLLRNVLEGMIYGIFPIICILMMLPTAARAGLLYLKSLLWVQLWAPLYAVLNLAVTLYSRAPGRAALTLPDGSLALTLSNHTALGEALSELSAIAGYLSLSIPLIAYMMLHATGAVAASLASGLMHSYEGPTSRAAEEVSTGNIALSNAHVGNATWWQENQAPTLQAGYTTWTDTAAQTHTSTPSGVHAVQAPKTSMPVSMHLEERVQQHAESRYESAVAQVQSSQLSLQQSVAGMQQFVESFNSHWSEGRFHELGLDQQHIDRAAHALDQLSGYTDSTAAGSQVQQGRSVSAEGRIGASIARIAGIGVSASSSGRADYSADSLSRETHEERTTLRAAYDTLHSLSASEAVQERMGQEFRSSHQQAASSTELVERREGLQAALSESESSRDLLAHLQGEGVLNNADLSGRLYWSVAAEQGMDRAGQLFATHHGSLPQATPEQRQEAAHIIERHAASLTTALTAEFAPPPQVQADPATLHIQADTQLDAPTPGVPRPDIGTRLDEATARLQSARQEQGLHNQQQREQGQATLRRAAGVLGDQHAEQQAGQADATDTAIGNATRHYARPSTVSTIRKEPKPSD